MNLPTLILVPVVAVVLLMAALRAARLFRSWRQSRTAARVHGEDRDRIALMDEKQRLLVALKDLELEHQLGKVSDADFAGLKRYYERETLRLIAELGER